jgi:hypothetical protein
MRETFTILLRTIFYERSATIPEEHGGKNRRSWFLGLTIILAIPANIFT